MKTKKAYIVLEDGTSFSGISFGAHGERTGEVVFNTSMTGYQEILTDPSYKGQLVTMTYPLIGNYGVNSDDVESIKPQVEGFIVKEYSKIYSNWRGTQSLGDYLKEHNIIGIEDIDTRALTRHIRVAGAMKAVLSTVSDDIEILTKKAQESPGLIRRDLVKEVTCEKPYHWNSSKFSVTKKEGKRFRIAAIDCGIKFEMLRILEEHDCDVMVFPAHATTVEILDYNPHGILLSNGPGDPAGVPYVVETIKTFIDRIPLFGICLGHQLLGLALGGKTYKLKFGHRGANHPVKDLKTGKINITSQNHGFCVDSNSLDNDDIEISHINLNDQTLEGIRHKNYPLFSVQYHPEASPGPHDAQYLFNEFFDMIQK
ncbi:glutamine-hydrolyzing carbamoyl-phosphate synthase small subunit [Chlamydiota bacterium]